MKIRVFLALLLAPLAGCVTEQDPWLATETGDIAASSSLSGAGNRSIPAELAWAHLAGLRERPLSVRSLSGNGSTLQQIVYPNRTSLPGENMLTIERASAGLGHRLQAPTRQALIAEMKTALPGLSLQIDPAIRRNGFGPYGVASADLAGKGACVFAWQTVEDWPGTSGAGRQAASIRLRYCDPSATRESLISLLATLSPNGGLYGYPAAVTIPPAAPPSAPVATKQVTAAPSVQKNGRVAMASRVAEQVDSSPSVPQSVRIPLPES